jgi:aminopeptidase N
MVGAALTDAVASLLRDFSAPVRVVSGLGDAELARLMASDGDAFARWDAGQMLAMRLLVEAVGRRLAGQPVEVAAALREAFAAMLDQPADDPAFLARALTLPGRSFVAQQLQTIEVDALVVVFRAFQQQLGAALAPRWRATHAAMRDRGAYRVDAAAMGRRALKNAALAWLLLGRAETAEALALDQYASADNMTDRLGALRALCEAEAASCDALLGEFYHVWRHEPLVVNKWFALQAQMEDAGALERIERLTRHPDFSTTNPNRVRALLGTFATANLGGFHRKDGAAYRFLAERILELDRTNPQVAARLLTAFGRWRRFDPGRQELMRGELERVLASPGLSRDSYEIASRSLG